MTNDNNVIDMSTRRTAETTEEYASEATALIEHTNTLSITTNADYEKAADLARTIKGKLDGLEAERKRITKPLDEAKKQVMAQFKNVAAPYDAALVAVRKGMAGYLDRVATERKQAEAEARAAEEERQAGLLEEMANAAGKGDTAQVEWLRSEAEEAPLSPALPPPPKVSGVSARENWTFEVVDVAKVPRAFLMPDDKKIRGVVRAMKGDTNIPGIRAYRETGTAISGKWDD